MKRIFFYSLITLLFLFTFTYSQKNDVNINLKGFDEFIEKAMKDWNVPGLAIAVVKNDKVVLSKGYGYRDIKTKEKVTPNTLFPIASCSKAFTTAAMGILIDQGKLNLDKPVRTYISDFKLSDDYITEKITPRDLVTHRSGLARHDWLWWRSPFTRKELLEKLKYLEFNKELRQTYQYNNLMFTTAGIVVERISGKSWEEFVQENILNKLEMKNTNFTYNELMNSKDHATPYQEHNNKVEEYSFCNADALGPAGGINSCVNDMANWLIMQMNSGKFKDKQIVSEKTLKEIHSPQIVASSSKLDDELFYSNYGMGWGINSYRGNLMISHWGGLDGIAALVIFLPKEKVGAVIFVNLEYANLPGTIAYNLFDKALNQDQIDWSKRYKDRIAKQKEKDKEQSKVDTLKKEGTTPSHSLDSYVGKYENPAYGTLILEKSDNKLRMTYNGLSTNLNHYHYDVFQAEDEATFDKMKITFGINNRGDITKASVPLETSVKDIVFTKTN